MKHLFKNWNEVKESFKGPIFLMTDYDGTLTPIVERPKDAELSESMRELLDQLTNFCPVGIISGRALDDLKSRIKLEGVYYSGNHGYEISGPEISFVKEEAEKAKDAIEKICQAIEKESNSIEGILVENKEFTASVHYRLVSEESVPKVEQIVKKVVGPHEQDRVVRLNRGKKVFEVKPDLDWDKGKAVSLLIEKADIDEEATPIYLGDDVTDEDAFSVLEDNGIGILVSDREKESAAKFRLRGVEEVKLLFDKLVNLLK